MANILRSVADNVTGEYFVDDSCINCDTCRQLAPMVFDDNGDYSFVFNQPDNNVSIKLTQQAIVSCPTNSIGSTSELDKKVIWEDFPLRLEENVYYCGFNSPKSFGGNSYFVVHPEGNWSIDSPPYSKYLSNKFKELGGIRYIFITHRDDVVDAAKYANENEGCERIIHYYDRSADRSAEIKIKGPEQVEITKDFKIIPSPGHTRGHQLLLYDNRFLFTGDHLYWRRDWDALRASRSYCWWDWPTQIQSMKKLRGYEFEWVLPGHGQRIKLDKHQMKQELEILINKIDQDDYW